MGVVRNSVNMAQQKKYFNSHYEGIGTVCTSSYFLMGLVVFEKSVSPSVTVKVENMKNMNVFQVE